MAQRPRRWPGGWERPGRPPPPPPAAGSGRAARAGYPGRSGTVTHWRRTGLLGLTLAAALACGPQSAAAPPAPVAGAGAAPAGQSPPPVTQPVAAPATAAPPTELKVAVPTIDLNYMLP